MRKRLVLLAVMTAALVVALTPGVAMANFSIHGGYEMDTDACAGCHRAHTAASSITWTDNNDDEQSALLLSTASEIYEFCYTCHDAAGEGADTNVEEGIYEGTLYGTDSSDTLNGGGFSEDAGFSASHMYNGATWFPYGGNVDPDLLGLLSDGEPQIEMTCSTCHDVHGSSNYRLLKDLVNGRAVGGYDPTAAGYSESDPLPTPWVISNETGYPSMGWLLHEPGASQVSTYTPDYTTERYAKPIGNDPDRGMAGWCASCHIQYMQETGAVYEANDPTLLPESGIGWEDYYASSETTGYNSLDGFGYAVRHRHPVNVALSEFAGQRSLVATNPLPLLHDADDVATDDMTDWLDCMTCHVAHGSSVDMTGYADVADSTNPEPNSGTGGVPPTGSNALLRLDNRGVCEVCHNK